MIRAVNSTSITKRLWEVATNSSHQGSRTISVVRRDARKNWKGQYLRNELEAKRLPDCPVYCGALSQSLIDRTALPLRYCELIEPVGLEMLFLVKAPTLSHQMCLRSRHMLRIVYVDVALLVLLRLQNCDQSSTPLVKDPFRYELGHPGNSNSFGRTSTSRASN